MDDFDCVVAAFVVVILVVVLVVVLAVVFFVVAAEEKQQQQTANTNKPSKRAEILIFAFFSFFCYTKVCERIQLDVWKIL